MKQFIQITLNLKHSNNFRLQAARIKSLHPLHSIIVESKELRLSPILGDVGSSLGLDCGGVRTKCGVGGVGTSPGVRSPGGVGVVARYVKEGRLRGSTRTEEGVGEGTVDYMISRCYRCQERWRPGWGVDFLSYKTGGEEQLLVDYIRTSVDLRKVGLTCGRGRLFLFLQNVGPGLSVTLSRQLGSYCVFDLRDIDEGGGGGGGCPLTSLLFGVGISSFGFLGGHAGTHNR